MTRHMRAGSMLVMGGIALTGPSAGNGSNPTSMSSHGLPPGPARWPGRARSCTVRQPPKVIDFSVSYAATSVAAPAATASAPERANSGVPGQRLQYRPGPARPAQPRSSRHRPGCRGPAAPVVAAPLEAALPPKECPNPQAGPGRAGRPGARPRRGKPLELVGHRGQVGRLVVADRRPLAEPLLIRAGLGTKDPSLRGPG